MGKLLNFTIEHDALARFPLSSLHQIKAIPYPLNSNFLKRSLASYENLCVLCHQFSCHFLSPPLGAVLEMDCEALCSLQPIKVKDHATARVLCSYSFSMFNMFTVPFPSMSRLSESHAVRDSAALFLGLQTGSVPCRQLTCEGMTDSLLSVNHVCLTNFWKGRERLVIGCRDLPELILVDLFLHFYHFHIFLQWLYWLI